MRLIKVTSAIDAMSHVQAQRFPGNTGYVSVGGDFVLKILDAIIEIARRMAASLLAAFDRDPKGELYSARTIMYGRAADLNVQRDAPPDGSKDWIQVVCHAFTTLHR